LNTILYINICVVLEYNTVVIVIYFHSIDNFSLEIGQLDYFCNQSKYCSRLFCNKYA